MLEHPRLLLLLFYKHTIHTHAQTHKLQTKALHESNEVTPCMREQPPYYEEGADC